jgi:hypothetical protein
VARVEWTVHLANKKPIWYQFQTIDGEDGYPSNHPLRNPGITDPAERMRMVIDPGPRTLTGPGESASFSRDSDSGGYPMTFPPADLNPYGIDTLGEIHTDTQGRLVVVGGHGRSGSMYRPAGIANYANNDGWWDDTSDGTVRATVVLDDGTTVEAAPSWVIAGPPGYAPQIANLVTLYDTMFDVAVRKMGYRPDMYNGSRWDKDYEPDFDTEVRPLLQRASGYPWVVAIPPKVHQFDFARLGDPDPQYNPLRRYFFEVLRPPNEQNALISTSTGYTMMPFLAGDDPARKSQLSSKFLKLTYTQYFVLEQWVSGRFQGAGVGRATGGASDGADDGQALSRATLENCVGGGFCPGIEMTWISRNPLIYSEPFRLKPRRYDGPPLSLGMDFAQGLEPGDVIKFMALPWQGDFNDCSSQLLDDRIVWWWPAQRPVFVYLESGCRKQVPWIGTDYDQNAPDYIAFADKIEMVKYWKELGFVFNVGTADQPDFIEVQRTLPRDGSTSVGD